MCRRTKKLRRLVHALLMKPPLGLLMATPCQPLKLLATALGAVNRCARRLAEQPNRTSHHQVYTIFRACSPIGRESNPGPLGPGKRGH
ncbi:hypothetical protein VTK56DRAFT_8199 [Thermocarpiscus australiensis]